MIDWQKISYPNFWVRLDPPPLTLATVKVGLVFFGSFIVLAFLSGLMAKVKNKQKQHYLARMWARLKSFFTTMGVLGLLLVWFSYEGAVLLSARFWFIIWLLVFGSWLTYIIVDTRKKKPIASPSAIAWRLKQKYLP